MLTDDQRAEIRRIAHEVLNDPDPLRHGQEFADIMAPMNRPTRRDAEQLYKDALRAERKLKELRKL